MKKPDLILLIAIWEFITAFVALIGIAAIAVFAFPDVIRPLWGPALAGGIFGLTIGMLVLLCYTGIAITGGIGLIRGQEWGRILSIVHSALSLFNFPVGTTIGILVIVYLTRANTADYFRAGGEKQ